MASMSTAEIIRLESTIKRNAAVGAFRLAHGYSQRFVTADSFKKALAATGRRNFDCRAEEHHSKEVFWIEWITSAFVCSTESWIHYQLKFETNPTSLGTGFETRERINAITAETFYLMNIVLQCIRSGAWYMGCGFSRCA